MAEMKNGRAVKLRRFCSMRPLISFASRCDVHRHAIRPRRGSLYYALPVHERRHGTRHHALPPHGSELQGNYRETR